MKKLPIVTGPPWCCPGRRHRLAQATPVGLWKTIDDETKTEKSLVRIVDSGGVLSGRSRSSSIPRPSPTRVRQVHRRPQGQAGAGHDHPRNLKPNADDKPVGGRRRSSTPTTARSTSARLKPVDGGKELQVRGYIGPFYRTSLDPRGVTPDHGNPNRFPVRKVAVLGAGVMGAQIAAHLVNVQGAGGAVRPARQGRARRTASSPRPSTT
jgi:hypothetical protein